MPAARPRRWPLRRGRTSMIIPTMVMCMFLMMVVLVVLVLLVVLLVVPLATLPKIVHPQTTLQDVRGFATDRIRK